MARIFRTLVISIILGAMLASVASVWGGHATPKVQAVSGSDFRAGRIIDDAVFNYSGSMSVAQIQSFLDGKMPDCDRWGTKPRGNTTRRAYAESLGIVFPLTCLKDYYENTSTKANNLEGRPVPTGAKSAAQIIWEAGQEYSINPQVILVLLQKEQSLLTDDWPWPVQFRAAMGYGCPDTAACDSEYYGFYNQVHNAARQFRRYANEPNLFNHLPFTTNYVRWHPNGACGGGNVFLETQATASLYNYTPYQPNQAALDNLYGLGDGCSSYGNRNFWRIFSDWFGSTTLFDPYGWEVIKTANDSAEYLAIGNTKRWISSGELKNDWHLNMKPVRTVSQSYLDSIATLPALGRLGYFQGNYYFVAGGKKYLLEGRAMLKAWGQLSNTPIAVPATIPLSTLTDARATHFVSQIGLTQHSRLINGKRYPINEGYTGRWHGSSIALPALAFNQLAVGADVNYRVSINGTKYLVDAGQLLNVSNTAMLRDFGQTGQTFTAVPQELLETMPAKQAKRLVRNVNLPHWYMLLGGTKYYVPKGEIAKAWGIDTPLGISPELYQEFASSSSFLSSIVKEQGTGKIYMLDGRKHEATGVMTSAAQAASVAPPTFASEYLEGIPTGNAIDSPVISASGHLFAIMNGRFYHIANNEILNGLGVPRKYSIDSVNIALPNSLLAGQPANMFVRSGSTTYFLQDGFAFPIDPDAVSDWIGDRTPVTYDSAGFSSRFDVSSVTLGHNITAAENNQRYVMRMGFAVSVGSVGDAYDTGSWPKLSIFGITRRAYLTFLTRSTDASDGRIWLISKGTKHHILDSQEMNAYSKRGAVPVSHMSPSGLATLPQVGGGRLKPFIYADGRGFKLLDDNGNYFSFGDGDTLINFAQGNSAQNLSFSVYNDFSRPRGNVTRLIRGPDGRVFWVEGGKKRWISNGDAYRRYSGTRLTDVGAFIVDWLPDGAVIN